MVASCLNERIKHRICHGSIFPSVNVSRRAGFLVNRVGGLTLIPLCGTLVMVVADLTTPSSDRKRIGWTY